MVFWFVLAQNPWSELLRNVWSALGALFECSSFTFVQNEFSIHALILVCSMSQSAVIGDRQEVPWKPRSWTYRSSNRRAVTSTRLGASSTVLVYVRGFPVGSAEETFLMVESVQADTVSWLFLCVLWAWCGWGHFLWIFLSGESI